MAYTNYLGTARGLYHVNTIFASVIQSSTPSFGGISESGKQIENYQIFANDNLWSGTRDLRPSV